MNTMSAWYKSILGITAAVFFFGGITLTVFVYLTDKHFEFIFLLQGTMFGTIYFILYYAVEQLVSKNVLWLELFPKKIIKLIISMAHLPIPLFVYLKYVNPDTFTDKKIVFILPENYE